MKRSFLFPCLALALAGTAAPADTARANLDGAAIAAPGPVGRLYLADELYRQGLAARDALALVQAARMMARVAILPAPADRLPQHRGKAVTLDPASLKPFALPGPTLDSAVVLAQGDETILALIDAERGAEAVPQGGVRQSLAALAPGMSDTWTLAFYGAATAELAVLGNGASTLSVTVADDRGAPVCQTGAVADRLYCRFTPAENGRFTVTVTNSGPGAESYRLITN